MDKAGHGDLNVQVYNTSKDEIGSLSRSFMKMTDALKDVLSTINIASEQVTTDSQQFSDSSMSLSQGAPEQVASIKGLTATIEEISSQTEQNATVEVAKETTHLIQGSMEKVKDGTSIAKVTAGSLEKIVDQINQTTEYVNRITTASSEQAFGLVKSIKVLCE